MSSAAAKRRKKQDNDRASGLWIDYSRLPHARPSANFNMPPESAHYNRYLELADVALGTKKDKLPFLERRKSRKKDFKGVDRRSSR
jgi:hypothetical protein